jgi:hypothetical protein
MQMIAALVASYVVVGQVVKPVQLCTLLKSYIQMSDVCSLCVVHRAKQCIHVQTARDRPSNQAASLTFCTWYEFVVG